MVSGQLIYCSLLLRGWVSVIFLSNILCCCFSCQVVECVVGAVGVWGRATCEDCWGLRLLEVRALVRALLGRQEGKAVGRGGRQDGGADYGGKL